MTALDQAWIEWMADTAPDGKTPSQGANWRKANPGEWAKLNAYRLGGPRPELVTHTGREHVFLTDAWLPPQPPAPGSGFVTRDGSRLMLDGKVFTFKGINCYGALGKCGPEIHTAEIPGGSTLRFWAFKSQIDTDWLNMDLLVERAHAAKIRLLPVLSNDARGPDGQIGCQGAIDDASFATFIGQIAARYRDEPAILMWQLINEGVKATAWHATMTATMKAADPNHLVSWGAYNNANYNLVNKGDDVLDAHDYEQGNRPMPSWLRDKLLACQAVDLPAIIGESGIRAAEISTATRRDWFRAKMDAAFAAGASGYLMWGWRTTDGFGIEPGDPALELLA